MLTDVSLFLEREARSETIVVRVTPNEKQRVNQLAQRRGMTVSKFVLFLISQENGTSEELYQSEENG